MKPTKNEVCSAKEFKSLCIAVMRTINTDMRKFRLNDEVIRHLRGAILVTVKSKAMLPEGLSVLLQSIASSFPVGPTTTKIRKADIQQWLAPPVGDEEEEWSTDEDLSAAPLHQARRVLERYRDKDTKKVYYLVDWEPTWELRDGIANELILRFERAKRALVRRTLIEYEAVEAGKN